VNKGYVSNCSPGQINPFAVEGRKVAEKNREGANGEFALPLPLTLTIGTGGFGLASFLYLPWSRYFSTRLVWKHVRKSPLVLLFF